MPPQRTPAPDRPDPSPVSSLPPESRFATHALAAGATVEEIAALMQLPPERVQTHLRSAARAELGSSPTPSAGTSALIECLEPVLVGVRAWQAEARDASTADDVRLGAWAAGRLDGPLLLATLEWAGDDPARLRRGLALHRDPSQIPATPPATSGRSGCAGAVGLLLAVLATGYALAASS